MHESGGLGTSYVFRTRPPTAPPEQQTTSPHPVPLLSGREEGQRAITSRTPHPRLGSVGWQAFGAGRGVRGSVAGAQPGVTTSDAALP